MRKVFLSILIFFVIFFSKCAMELSNTKMVDSVDNYFGQTYYRPLPLDGNTQMRVLFKTGLKNKENIAMEFLKKIPGRDSLFNDFVALDKLQGINYSGMIFN